MAQRKKTKKASEEEVDEFLEKGSSYQQRRYQQYRGRRSKELELWEQWNQRGRKPEDLEPLLNSVNNLIKREAQKRMSGLGGSIPRAALEQEARLAALTAIETYDPSRGAQLTTHIHNNFRRMTDFIAANRNTKYMPKSDVARYGEFHNAQEAFRQEFGRDPTTEELQTLLPKWPKRQIQKMERGYGAEVFAGLTGELEHDAIQPDKIRSAVLLMKPRMTQKQKEFAELHYPPLGQRQLSVKQIARKMGIPEHKAYRLKAQVEKLVGGVVRKS